MKFTRIAASAAVAAVLTAGISSTTMAEELALDTEEAKVNYGLGMMLYERILGQYGDVIDYDLLLEGMKGQQSGTPQMTLDQAAATLGKYQETAASKAAEVAKASGEKYLADNKAREGVTVTDSGLQYEVLKEGDGAKPTADDTVSVHYVGTLTDGTEFDSSIARGEPATFPLKGVIPGWTEGLQLMSVGSKYRFVIPSDLGYGDRGAGQAIRPGETLVFEVELLEIK